MAPLHVIARIFAAHTILFRHGFLLLSFLIYVMVEDETDDGRNGADAEHDRGEDVFL